MDAITEMKEFFKTAAKNAAHEASASLIEHAAREGEPFEEIEGQELTEDEEKELEDFIFDNVIMVGSLEALQADLAEKLSENYHNPRVCKTWVDHLIFEADEGTFGAKYSRNEDGALIVENFQPLKRHYLPPAKAKALTEILDEENYQQRRGQFLAGLGPLPIEDSKLPPSTAPSPVILSEQEMERQQVLAGVVAHPYAPTPDDVGEGEPLND